MIETEQSEQASRTASGIPLKDPDSIKLFIGQVPRTMAEAELEPIFGEHGQIYELTVLRDKSSGNHKGCAFVTFCTLEAAERAQRSLHGSKVLPGMSRPIQVKPANSDDAAKLERKLFIGMVSKQATETDLHGMFDQYGEIEELSILKDTEGSSKGCAFIKYRTAKDCHKAIRTMHHSLTMQGCSSPIVVKWADTDKERVGRRLQKITEGGPVPPNMPFNAVGGGPPPNNRPGYASLMSHQQQHQQQHHQQQGPPAPPPETNSALLSAITPLLHNLASQSNPETNKALVNALIAALQALASCSGSGGNNRALTDIANLLNTTVSGATASSGDYSSQKPDQRDSYNSFNIPNNNGSIYNVSIPPGSPAPSNSGKQSEGPDGSNLFIYHIPAELRDHDLSEMFSTFGSIVSCKIFIDKATNQSKCFGFVSFDNPKSAQLAIQAMNGFKIGSKRLKVQLKKPRDAAKPF